ncbi:hypothetical protein GCM10012275_21260 [Longimycelium tulufanense]|uniref:Thioesterase domain-containing protein n=1 Tax=Longimycelium tulufanense TaxID=907463 RepID=A0A8J3FVA3_9PSEU|nr:PaaI family thioesterase [Longimycelium tulufanense]GGM50162.1 hypothetical protein GCM10012275_21260 [Longimycelium tulufanense]
MANTDEIDLSTLSGLEFLRMAVRMPEPPPTIGDVLGMTVDSLEEGQAVMSLRPQPQFANPLGTLHGGVCSTLLDSVMGCAVHSALPAGASYTTLELKVNFTRAVPLTAERITAVGTTIHVGGRIATAEGRVTDDEGRLVAHATTTCMIFR